MFSSELCKIRLTIDERHVNPKHDIPLARLENSFFEIAEFKELGDEIVREHHRHDFFEILWSTSSTGSFHYIDFEPHPVEAGLMYLMAPGQVHAYTGRAPSGCYIAFSVDFFSSIMEPEFTILFNPFVNCGISIPDEAVSPLQQLVELMFLESRGKNDFCILLAYLKTFLLHIARLHREKNFSFDKNGKRMSLLFEMIEKHFRMERHAEFYASALGITPKRLNEILHEKFDVTLTRILHSRLILEAKREIAYGRKSFKEVSFELGFSDQSYFSRFFKAQTGYMPADFRKHIVSLSSTGNGLLPIK